jgi:hypothetical protein
MKSRQDRTSSQFHQVEEGKAIANPPRDFKKRARGEKEQHLF